MSASLILDKELFALAELTFVGRDVSCEIVLEEEAVNRYHALIVRRSDDYLLVDFKSMNGTFVNGLRVDERSLRDRDSIQIGTRVMTFRQERRESSDPHRQGLQVLQVLGELAGQLLIDAREAVRGISGSALFRPADATSWWLIAGDIPALGMGKRGFLEEWACQEGVFYTSEAVRLGSADTLEPASAEVPRWFLGISMRAGPAASLLLLVERDEEMPATELQAALDLLGAQAKRLGRELDDVPLPARRDLPPPPMRSTRRGLPAGRLVLNQDRVLDLSTSTVYRIGRDPSRCDLVLDDDQVSRQHALVVVDPRGAVMLLDFRSVNGLLLEGKATQRAQLKDGDRIEIGAQQIRFECAAVVGGDARATSPEDYEPCMGIRARQIDLDQSRPHFSMLEEGTDVLLKMMAIVREQFAVDQLAILWLPLDPVCVPDSCVQAASRLSLPGSEVPAVPLRTGLGASAIDHVLAHKTGFFVRDFNTTSQTCGGTEGSRRADEPVSLQSVGSFFVTPLLLEESRLSLLVGATRPSGRVLGRPEFGGIQALVQSAVERHRELGGPDRERSRAGEE
jgi:pSer/pThr/pTyr-binding forkhead associated (FHA) protein